LPYHTGIALLRVKWSSLDLNFNCGVSLVFYSVCYAFNTFQKKVSYNKSLVIHSCLVKIIPGKIV